MHWWLLNGFRKFLRKQSEREETNVLDFCVGSFFIFKLYKYSSSSSWISRLEDLVSYCSTVIFVSLLFLLMTRVRFYSDANILLTVLEVIFANLSCFLVALFANFLALYEICAVFLCMDILCSCSFVLSRRLKWEKIITFNICLIKWRVYLSYEETVWALRFV